MLSAHQITKTYGLHTVLQTYFSINPSDQPGTESARWLREIHLLRILTGQEQPVSGMLARTSHRFCDIATCPGP